MAARTAGTAELQGEEGAAPGFSLRVGDFDGPFDVLLSLLAKHELDITEIALSIITDEFIQYVHALETEEQLDRASEFLVVAATLLDMKVASLLPQGELVDAEDVAALEARDLLFARLLQYRAFKQVAAVLGSLLDAESTRHSRQVRLEDKYRQATPELQWTTSLEDFAAMVWDRPGHQPWNLRVCTDPDGEVVGATHVHLTGDAGYVARIGVRADQRRRGLASAMLADAFGLAREHGAVRCYLATDSRTGALALYEKVGMVVSSAWVNLALDL